MLTQEEMNKAYIELRKAELFKSLTERNSLDVCAVREYVESIGGDRHGHQAQPFSKWHCVSYSDMPEGAKNTILAQVHDYIVEQERQVEARKNQLSLFGRVKRLFK